MKVKRTVSRELFGEVLKKGRVYHSALFSIRVIPTTTPSCTSVVSKKVLKTAVSRNTAKRKLRDIVAGLLKETKKCYTVIVFVNKPIATTSRLDLREAVVAAMSKLGVY